MLQLLMEQAKKYKINLEIPLQKSGLGKPLIESTVIENEDENQNRKVSSELNSKSFGEENNNIGSKVTQNQENFKITNDEIESKINMQSADNSSIIDNNKNIELSITTKNKASNMQMETKQEKKQSQSENIGNREPLAAAQTNTKPENNQESPRDPITGEVAERRLPENSEANFEAQNEQTQKLQQSQNEMIENNETSILRAEMEDMKMRVAQVEEQNRQLVNQLTQMVYLNNLFVKSVQNPDSMSEQDKRNYKALTGYAVGDTVLMKENKQNETQDNTELTIVEANVNNTQQPAENIIAAQAQPPEEPQQSEEKEEKKKSGIYTFLAGALTAAGIIGGSAVLYAAIHGDISDWWNDDDPADITKQQFDDMIDDLNDIGSRLTDTESDVATIQNNLGITDHTTTETINPTMNTFDTGNTYHVQPGDNVTSIFSSHNIPMTDGNMHSFVVNNQAALRRGAESHQDTIDAINKLTSGGTYPNAETYREDLYDALRWIHTNDVFTLPQ